MKNKVIMAILLGAGAMLMLPKSKPVGVEAGIVSDHIRNTIKKAPQIFEGLF